MSRALRIVHVVVSDGFGGVERHVAGLASQQVRLGADAVVIGGNHQFTTSDVGDSRVQFRHASTLVEAIRGLDEFRLADIIHAHMTAAETATVLALRARHVPLVATRHFAAPRGASALGGAVAPLIRRRLSAQIAISRYVADHVDGGSTVIHPGVADQLQFAAAAERTRTVLVAQRLEREKRTEEALRAFKASGLAVEGWRLLIAGSGTEETRLRVMAADLGIAAVTDLLGYRTDVPVLMSRAGLLLAPCDVEGLGLTVLEAMSQGLPVVASDAGAHRETVGTADGAAVYPPGGVERAGELLRRLALSPETRDTYGAELQRHQRNNFTFVTQVERTEIIYRSLL